MYGKEGTASRYSNVSLCIIPILTSSLMESVDSNGSLFHMQLHLVHDIQAKRGAVATLASSPLLTWLFFRLSKDYEC
jgi:hypothetical protein